jgi:hypothetical protein
MNRSVKMCSVFAEQVMLSCAFDSFRYLGMFYYVFENCKSREIVLFAQNSV